MDRRARRRAHGGWSARRQATRMLALAAALQTNLAASRRAPCGWACPRGRQPSSSVRRDPAQASQRPSAAAATAVPPRTCRKQKHPYGGCSGARAGGIGAALSPPPAWIAFQARTSCTTTSPTWGGGRRDGPQEGADDARGGAGVLIGQLRLPS